MKTPDKTNSCWDHLSGNHLPLPPAPELGPPEMLLLMTKSMSSSNGTLCQSHILSSKVHFFTLSLALLTAKEDTGNWVTDTEANSCTVSAASAKSLQDDFFTGDRRGGMGKERKRLSRHTRVIKKGSSSFLIQSFQLSILNSIAKDPRPGCNLKMLIAKLESTCLVLVRFVLFVSML